jgi:hypothetical protein
MATLLSWTSLGIGDLDVFMPSPPCLVVYTSYEDGEPESTVMSIWQHEKTGALHHELVYQQAVPFETAIAWRRSMRRPATSSASMSSTRGRRRPSNASQKQRPPQSGVRPRSRGQESGAGKAGRRGQGPKA